MGLILLLEQEISHNQVIHLRSHKTAVGVFRAANNGLTPDIETCIHDNGAPGASTEGIDQLPVPRVHVPVDGLNPGGKVDVSNGRNIGSQVVQAIVKGP